MGDMFFVRVILSKATHSGFPRQYRFIFYNNTNTSGFKAFPGIECTFKIFLTKKGCLFQKWSLLLWWVYFS